jgi:hypothetical protein
MRRFLLGTATAVLCVGLTGTAQAGPHGGHGGGHHGGHGGGHHGSHGGHHRTQNHRARGAKSFRGKGHFRRSAGVWDKRYGCRLYLDGDTGAYYYWCPPDDCYYPVDYCPYGTYSWDE